jgi:hypothetical protein
MRATEVTHRCVYVCFFFLSFLSLCLLSSQCYGLLEEALPFFEALKLTALTPAAAAADDAAAAALPSAVQWPPSTMLAAGSAAAAAKLPDPRQARASRA